MFAGNMTISMNSKACSGAILLKVSRNDSRMQVKYQTSSFTIFPITVNSVDIYLNDWSREIDRFLNFPSKTFKTELSTNYWKEETWSVLSDRLPSQLKDIGRKCLPSRLNDCLAV